MEPLPPVEGGVSGEPSSGGGEVQDSSQYVSEDLIVNVQAALSSYTTESDESEESVTSNESVQSELNLDHLRLSNDKLAYINQVKSAFGSNSKKYIGFQKLVLKRDTQSMGWALFKLKARLMLKEHVNLIMGLNLFLPPEIHITVASVPSLLESETELSWDVVKLVKNRCEDYQCRILHVVTILMAKMLSSAQKHSQLVDLFADRPELVMEFGYYDS